MIRNPQTDHMADSTLRKRSDRRSSPMSKGPRPATITALLNYSKALKVMELPPVGKVEVVLN